MVHQGFTHRSEWLRGVLLAFVILMAIGGGATRVLGEQRELKGETSEKVDAMLVLDGSGSMLVTDPAKLRDEGARLFAQFLKPGDRLGIIGFSEDAKVIRPLTDFDSSKASEIAQGITTVGTSGQYTNLLEGIKRAKEILETEGRSDASHAIVLLSDGKMDPNPSQGSADSLTSELVENHLPKLRTSGTKVYTLSFSDQTDKELLKEIAAATDGINWFTPTADKIHESFADLFLAVKKPQVVPLTKKGFKIDADVQEATFYINRENVTGEIELISPDRRKFSQAAQSDEVKWFRGQKFDVITIAAPMEGDWQIEGVSSNDGFATVLTKLRLVTDWPANTSAGEKALLQARLYEEDKPVALPEMSDVIKYAFQITPTDKISEPIVRDFLHDDGKDGDAIAKDGIFSAEVKLDEPGEYRLRVLAKAPTFERNQQIPFRVKPELITLKVVSVEEEDVAPAHGEGHHADHGKSGAGGVKDYFRVELDTEALSFKKSEVKLFAVDENRARYELPLIQSRDNRLRYEVATALLPKDGQYRVTATLAAEGKKKEVKVSSRILEYTKMTPEESEHQEETHVVVKEPEPEKPDSPLLYILLVVVVNGGIGAAVYFLLNKMSVETTVVAHTFESSDPIVALIDQMKGRLALADVDLSAPVFTDPNFKVKPIWQKGAATAVAAVSQAVPAVPQAAADQSEQPTESAEESEEETDPAQSEEEEQ